ncbi:MAG: hypothetical protein ACRDSL_17335 [Pseudonocardiaceae bacterium]
MTTALVNDPVASGSEQFGLSRPQQAPLCHDVPSPPEVRPWGCAVCGAAPSLDVLYPSSHTVTQSYERAAGRVFSAHQGVM